MVDFNAPEMLSSNKGEIINIVILGHRDEVINAFKLWKEKKLNETTAYKPIEDKLKGCLFALFLEIIEVLKRKLEEEEFQKIKSLLFSNKQIEEEELFYCYENMNRVLDEMNLIRIDYKRKINYLDTEEENEANGL